MKKNRQGTFYLIILCIDIDSIVKSNSKLNNFIINCISENYTLKHK